MDWQYQSTMHLFIQALRENIKLEMPNNPVLSGWSTYSQFDEDGIIRVCLTEISKAQDLSKTFIEIGCGNGLENNTHQLVLDGYRGVWVDGNADHISSMASQLGGLCFNQLLIQERVVTLDNIMELIEQSCQFLENKNLDFLSCDVDGNDIHLIRAILTVLKPKLICVEYNGKFVPPTRIEMTYRDTHEWLGDDYYGASLQSWVDALTEYSLVCCNLTGVNAFFIRNDLLGEGKIGSTNQLFQPCRHFLINLDKGHPSSLRWLKQRLTHHCSTEIACPVSIEPF